MKKFSFLIILFAFTYFECQSQKLALSTLAQGFLSGNSDNLYMSATIGQTIIGSADCGSYKVFMGFQQPSYLFSTPVLESVFIKVTLYPNPSTDFLIIQGELKTANKDLHLKIIDIMGRPLIVSSIKQFQNQYKIDVHMLPAGIYNLFLSNAETNLQNFLFIKK